MKGKHKELGFLIYGDVFGKLGRTIVKETIDDLKKEYKPNMVIANAENVTHGAGISVDAISELMEYGVQFFTGGNHSFDNKPGNAVYAIPNVPLIRPANFPKGPGVGYKVMELGEHKILFINLLGTLFMKDEVSNPFVEAKKIIKEFDDQKLAGIIVDFHAETTSEKVAFAMSLDGKVSCIFGTHTHIPTADERIMPGGTGYITDTGFCGPLDSVIGVNPEAVIYNFTHNTKSRSGIVESGRKYLNAIYIKIDPTTARCTHIQRITKIY